MNQENGFNNGYCDGYKEGYEHGYRKGNESTKEEISTFGQQEATKPIEIDIHQTNPNCLVYYTIKIGDWIFDGDALDVPSALKLIAHNLEWDYRGDEQ
jgi:hypothetical protein